MRAFTPPPTVPMAFDSVMALIKDPKKYEKLFTAITNHRNSSIDALKELIAKDKEIDDRELEIAQREKKFEIVIKRTNDAEDVAIKAKTKYDKGLESVQVESKEAIEALKERERNVIEAEKSITSMQISLVKEKDDLVERAKVIVAEETRLDGVRAQYADWEKQVKKMSGIVA